MATTTQQPRNKISTSQKRQLASVPKHTFNLHSEDLFAEAGRKILLRHLETMKSYEFAAAEGSDIEGVHQMRVATRRLRSAYSVFRKAFPKEYDRTILQPIKRTASVLGKVRDMDVLIAKLEAYRSSVKDETPDLEPLHRHLQTRRKRARRSLLLWLDSQKYSKFLHEGSQLLTKRLEQDESSPAYHQTIGDAIPLLVYKRIAEVQHAIRSRTTLSNEDYHDIRIHCKRLRYTLESFSSLIAKGASPMIISLKKIQDILGEMNDADVMLMLMNEITESSTTVTEPSWDMYKQSLVGEIEKMKQLFPSAWKQAFTKKNRKALSKAIGDL